MSRMARKRQAYAAHPRRHPYERGTPLHRWAVGILRSLLGPRAWTRHPAPFAKRDRARRITRQFRIRMKEAN